MCSLMKYNLRVICHGNKVASTCVPVKSVGLTYSQFRLSDKPVELQNVSDETKSSVFIVTEAFNDKSSSNGNSENVQEKPWMKSLPRALIKMGELQSELKVYEDSLWMATARSAMEDFETTYGSNAEIDSSGIPQIGKSGITFDEQTRRVRKLRMKWILENKAEERKIIKLKKLLPENGYTDESIFADDYANGYFELSEILKKRLLAPGRPFKSFPDCDWTTDKEASKALSVFMKLYKFPKEVVERFE
ncbi:uncharacterized protein LOC135841846 isoform X2 [Planococcus citri]|uniref:uncharacterized protein LOC135841846 isoform X2 n=1 Tax=Planococcus citri TaxID=170843 RepID=UPI0031F857E6